MNVYVVSSFCILKLNDEMKTIFGVESNESANFFLVSN